MGLESGKKVSGIKYITGVKLKRTWRPNRKENMKETVFPLKQSGRRAEFINV
jgi:hypothetical protein